MSVENTPQIEALKTVIEHLKAERFDEGEAMLLELEAAGDAPAEVPFLLGQIHRHRGILPAARDMMTVTLARAPNHLPALLTLATLMAQLREDGAEAEFKRALDLAESQSNGGAAAEAHYGLALLAQDRGDRQKAADLYRHALEAYPRHVKARNNLGSILLDDGKISQAIDCLRQATQEAPTYLGAQFNLGNACLAGGKAPAAEMAFRAAIAIKPDFARAHNNLGVALKELARPKEAEEAFRQCLKLNPKDADGVRNLANILNDQDALEEAITHYRAAIALRASDRDALLGLAEALIKTGDATAALATLDDALAIKPADTRSLSLKCAALAVKGPQAVADGETAETQLANHEKLLRRWQIEDLAPFEDLTALNDALAGHVINHPSLREDVTTKNGLDTDEILSEDVPAVQTLKRFIESSVAAFMADIGVGPEHPFPPGMPANYRFKCWGVRMWKQGYQVPHIHHNAWLSGVYYVRLPKAIAADNEAQEGWIEFGRGEDKLYRHAEPQTTRIKPEEGLMLTFPSYIWHRTIPFASEEDRISIAFDVIAQD